MEYIALDLTLQNVLILFLCLDFELWVIVQTLNQIGYYKIICWIICEAAHDEVANTSAIRDIDKYTEKAAKTFYNVLFVNYKQEGTAK